MAKSSRKRAKSKARKRKAPAAKAAKKTARKTAVKATPAARKTALPKGKAKEAEVPKSNGKKDTKAPAGKSKSKQPGAPKAAPKAPGNGIFSKLKSAFSPGGAKTGRQVDPNRIIPTGRLYGDPDPDRFAILDPANRTKTELPPIIERPSPLHLDSAPAREEKPVKPETSVRLRDPVVEQAAPGEPVRLEPVSSGPKVFPGDEEETPILLTDAIIERTVSQAMTGEPEKIPARPPSPDPFVDPIDEDLPSEKSRK